MASDRCGRTAGRRNRSCRPCQAGAVDIANHHRGALRREAECNSPADAVSRTRDDGDLAGEASHALLRSLGDVSRGHAVAKPFCEVAGSECARQEISEQRYPKQKGDEVAAAKLTVDRNIEHRPRRACDTPIATWPGWTIRDLGTRHSQPEAAEDDHALHRERQSWLAERTSPASWKTSSPANG